MTDPKPGVFIDQIQTPSPPSPGKTVCLQSMTIFSLQHWDELRPVINDFFRDYGEAGCLGLYVPPLKNCASDCCPWCGK